MKPHVVIEMSGPNIVIRATAQVDHGYTTSLAEVLNTASMTDTCVVIDPEPIRCDDTFAARHPGDAAPPTSPGGARPLPVEVVAEGVVRLRAERATWFIDVGGGRLCCRDGDPDVAALPSDGWTPVVAVRVTPRRLVALGLDGEEITADRAVGAAA